MQIGQHDIRLDNIGHWPKKIRIGSIAILVALLAILVYWFDSSSQLAQLNRLERQETKLKQQLVQRQAMAANLPTYQKQLQQGQQAFKQLLALLPTEQQLPQLVEDISKLGQGAGLNFELLQPQANKAHPFYSEQPIHIVVTGTYSQLLQFINQLSNMPRLLTIGNFTLAPVDVNSLGTQSSPTLKLDFTAHTYRYAPNAKATPEAK